MKKVREYFKNTAFILLLTCLFALSVRVLLFAALQPWNEQVAQNKVLAGDSLGYHDQAMDIMATLSFMNFGSWRAPGYPLFIAFIYFLFGTKPWIVLFVQIFLDVGVLIITYFIAKEIFKSKAVPLVAAFLYSISFPSAYYSIRFLGETVFTFIFALAILIFIRGLKKNKPGCFALTGFFVGVANLIRPISLYFPPVLFLVLLFSDSRSILKLRNMLIILMLFLITLSPWQFRNLKVYGHYGLTSNQGGNLCNANIAVAKARIENIGRQEAYNRLIGDSLEGVTDPFEESKILQRIALSYLSKHPLEYTKYHLEGIIKMFLGTTRSGVSDLFGVKVEAPASTDDLSENARKITGNLRNELPTLILFTKQMLEYLFVIIGLTMMMRSKDEKLYLLLLIMIILYFANVTGIVGYSRFRVPIIPFYLVVGAKGMFETFGFIMRRRQ